GSENFDDDWFKATDKLGATDLNGTTNNDRTNYFQNVPKTALDSILWLESDRMGNLLGAITQEKLDEQRGVVQNEKRQGENQPYGKVFNAVMENTYPKGHPYSWTVIGSLEDLNAASLDDVHEWFKEYYGAANAVIVVAGDITPELALEKTQQYFGSIPSGPPVTKHEAWISKRSGSHRQIMQDRVPQARVIKVWNTPELGTAAADHFDLLSDVLAGGKNSRLYERLVYNEQIATDVASFAWNRPLGGLFFVWATAQPTDDAKEVERRLAELETAIDEELAKLIAKGPTKDEMTRVKTQKRAGFIRGAERIGGFGGKSDILAASEVYAGSPDAHKQQQVNLLSATADDLRSAASAWLTDGEYVLEVHPFPRYTASNADVDRSAIPEPDGFPSVSFPEFKRGTLSNGLKVIVAERDTVPTVSFNLMLDAGYAADQFGSPGTASLAMAMLDEGTDSRTSLEISEELAMLGASIGAGSNLDISSVSLSALKENLEDSLDIYADVILNPSFPKSDFERLQKQRLAGIQQEKTRPFSMALRVFPGLLYGKDHAYGLPFSGSGTEDTVRNMQVNQLKNFHDTWFKPNNGTMIVVGDTTMEEIVPKLEEAFRGWKSGDVPKKNLSTVAHQENSSVYLIDRPNSEQSIIFAGHIAPPQSNPDEIAIEAMNEVLGGSFSARINLNLREDKGWSYGARSVIVGAKGQRPFLVYAPVQTDKTKESMLEIQNELNSIINDRPASETEVLRAKDKKTLTLPGRWETGGAVAGSLASLVRFGLPDDYWNRYSEEVRGLSISDVNGATRVVQPDKLVWVVVGDREKIEAGVRDLNLGPIQMIDSDGNLLEPIAKTN
ncbi:MAG: pitrilysin family protein, partial [Pseudomonadota bacterium]